MSFPKSFVGNLILGIISASATLIFQLLQQILKIDIRKWTGVEILFLNISIFDFLLLYFSASNKGRKTGGDGEDRTPGPHVANVVLSQLSRHSKNLWRSGSRLNVYERREATLIYYSIKFGGDGEDRTPGPHVANVVLSQLSYIPETFLNFLNFPFLIQRKSRAPTSLERRSQIYVSDLNYLFQIIFSF